MSTSQLNGFWVNVSGGDYDYLANSDEKAFTYWHVKRHISIHVELQGLPYPSLTIVGAGYTNSYVFPWNTDRSKLPSINIFVCKMCWSVDSYDILNWTLQWYVIVNKF